jgi:hypothetical protein
MASDLIKDIGGSLLQQGLQTLGLMVDQAMGGELEKAQLVPVEPSGDHPAINRGCLTTVEFMFNPDKIKWTNFVRWTRRPDSGSDSAAKTFGSSEGRTLQLNGIWFDTFEQRDSVRTTYIDKLEALGQRDHKGDHAAPQIKFIWGKFTGKADQYNFPLFVLENLDVEYTMFLNDGTPVRAKVSLTLREATSPEEQQGLRQNESPDHAKLVTIRRGDTLQTIAHAEYDDPKEWRRIANANNIDDPMRLDPGTKLLIPPILK